MNPSRWLPLIGLLAIQGYAYADSKVVPLRFYGTNATRTIANEGPGIPPQNPLDAPLASEETYTKPLASKPSITPADYNEVSPNDGVGFKPEPSVTPVAETPKKKEILPVVFVVPVEKETKEKAFKKNSPPPYTQDIQFALRYDSTTLKATDVATKGVAELNSSYDVRGQLAWRKILFPSLAINLGGYYRMVDFKQDEAKRLKEPRQGLHGAALTLEHVLHRRLTLTYGGGYDQNLFLTTPDNTHLEFESLMIPKGELGAKLRLVEIGKMTLRLNLLGTYLADKKTDDYKVKAGYAYQAGLNLRYLYRGNYFTELEVGYAERVQETTLTELNEKSFYGRLNFNFPLFEGSK